MRPPPKKLSSNDKNLIRRYLLWCYKTTRESLEKIDRKYTQLKVDEYILNQLKPGKELADGEANRRLKSLINNFELYMKNKEDDANKQKYLGENYSAINPEYQYLRNRFKAIEKAIIHFLSASELRNIKRLYEAEMTQRIVQAKDHT